MDEKRMRLPPHGGILGFPLDKTCVIYNTHFVWFMEE
jgi:hypothetical protein